MAALERRVRRAIEQIGEFVIRSGFDTYIADLCNHKQHSVCVAYARDRDIVYKWEKDALVRQLLLLHPPLSTLQTDEAMVTELKTFLEIA